MSESGRSGSARRPLIGLGDVIRAVRELQATGTAVAEVAAILGVSVAQPRVVEPQPVIEETVPAAVVEPLPPPPPETTVPSTTIISRTVVSADLLELTGGTPYPGIRAVPLAREATKPVPAVTPEPLLVPGWTRAILSTALATAGDSGEVDIEALVPLIATRGQIDRLPRIARPTMRRGVHVLLDRGPALAPFYADETWLARQVELVGGKDRVTVADFFTSPIRPVRGKRPGDEVPLPLPSPGTPILAVTDLGIGRPPGWTDWATPDEWLAFATRLRRAGCPLVVLVPYPRRRCPWTLRQSLMILPFDRRTSVSTVRRLLRTRTTAVSA